MSFSRDLGEDLERPRGRDAGPRLVEPDPAEALYIDIVVGGVVFGTVDAEQLRARAQMDLERVQGALDLLKWCRTHGGVKAEDMPRLEDELGEMHVRAVIDLARSISAAIGKAAAVPKLRRPR